MIIHGRVDGPVCRTVLSHGAPGILPKSQAISGNRCAHILALGNAPQRWTSSRSLGTRKSCYQSSQWLASTFMLSGALREPTSVLQGKRYHPRNFSSTRPRSFQEARAAETQSGIRDEQEKEELRSYVDQDADTSSEDVLATHSDSLKRLAGNEYDPFTRLSDDRRETHHASNQQAQNMTVEHQDSLTNFHAAIEGRIRSPNSVSLEQLYDLYRKLPEPRIILLSGYWRNAFLKAMGLPEKRDVHSMLRYFSLIADVKTAGLILRRNQWNYAIAYVTKYTESDAPNADMESALRLWREMEHEGKVPGNEVTFNLLFDEASKAGNFKLAEMIYQEMKHRGIEFNRYHHVSLIHYFGLKRDSAGVRAAYRDMVEAGEMIDTVVLNCVISGLLRCGEEAAAEETYERMKYGSALPPETPQRDYNMSKVITKVLMMFSKVGKSHPSLKDMLQKNTVRIPNLHTFQLLVNHYAVKVGDLPRVAQYLDEMKLLQIPVHPLIFLGIFKGFFTHGGLRSSEWSERRLRGVLEALYRAKDEHWNSFKLERWVVIWALRAVKKCSSSQDVNDTFDELAKRWDIPEDRQPWMHHLLELVVTDRDLNSDLGQWEGPQHSRRRKDGSDL